MNRKQLKENARQAMREAKPSPVWVSLSMILIVLVLQLLSWNINGEIDAARQIFAAWQETGVIAYVEPASAIGFGSVLTLALDVMSMVLSVGFVLYYLRVSRREKASFGDMFDAFGTFFRSIWISLLPSLLIGFWSIIYVVPVTYASMMLGTAWVTLAGIPLLIPMVIASYAYSQATYLMLDNPQLSCMQCIIMSKAIMRGKKWQLFKLDLSFLGWALLCIVPFVVLWVMPYQNITRAEFYKAATNDFLARTKQAAQEEEMAQAAESAGTDQSEDTQE